jgi:hypothetical protein
VSLLSAYAKNRKANLSKAEQNAMRVSQKGIGGAI